jgi:hypothetical protein
MTSWIVLEPCRKDASGAEHEIRAEKEGNYPFLPNAVRLVSSSIGEREDSISSVGNGFSIFSSLFNKSSATSTIYLVGMLINRDRNYHKYTIETALSDLIYNFYNPKPH